jgi:hypothetical protein
MYTKLVHRMVLITLLALSYPAASLAGFIGVGASVGFAPPPLPVYVQPPCPAPGYIWTPGYWAYSYDAGNYYWVPGTWVLAPAFGLLWTPGYWGLFGAEYVWHEGYWGPHVGFYGGINYGFGYFGSGFVGGYWRGHDFNYNRAVTNVSNVNVTNVYNRTVINNNLFGSRPSFNGTNGVEARPTRSDLLAMREPHRAPTAPQPAQAASARALPFSLASVNHGHPQVAATPQPGISHGQGVTAARFANRTSAPSTHSSRPQEQHGPPTPVGPHSAFGRSTARTPPAESRASSARWSTPPSYRPAQSYRRSPAHSPSPSRPASSPAPRTPPATHHTSQPPHVNREAPTQSQRRS